MSGSTNRTVYGPYPELDARGRPRWRIVIKHGTGRAAHKESVTFTSESEALAQLKLVVKAVGVKTVRSLIDDFEDHLRSEGRRPGTLVTNRYRLEGLLEPVFDLPVVELTEDRCRVLYRQYQEGRAPDTHQGALSLVKSLFEYARKTARLIKVNPWVDVDPRGRKNRGKPQLKKDDTRKLYRWLCANALADDRACGALMALALGLRAHEVVGAQADHLDEGGTELMITRSKTRAGVRSVRLPAVLVQALAKRAELRSGRLLPFDAPWVRAATAWACTQAGVTVVCAQALRGMYATATLESGLDPAAVARSLGHTNSRITKAAYAAQGAGHSAHVDQLTETLEGRTVPVLSN